MEHAKLVIVGSGGVFVDGKPVAGVVHVDFICGGKGNLPRAVLTIETERA